MKHNKLRIVFLALVLMLTFCLGFSASAADTAEKCIGASVDVSSFAQLKEALENYKSGANIVLKSNITVSDNSQNCEINVDGSGAVALDLNGYNISVTSNATKYLFNVTGSGRLYFVNQSGNRSDVGESRRSIIRFNTTAPSAAIIKLDQAFCEITNVNVDFIMGEDNAYKSTTDSSDTAIFLAEKGTALNIYSGTMKNSMKNGSGIVISPTESNKSKLNLSIGGNAEISAYKYSLSVDRNFIRHIKLGSVSFTKNGSDAFERIHVPSNATTTLKDLWNGSESGGSVTVRDGGFFSVSLSKKVTSLGKGDNITASKQCEGWSNKEDVVILNCRAGHVKVCGTCFMAFRVIKAHDSVPETGRPATCASYGKTNGEKCKECSYSSAQEIPKLGHDMVYRPGVEASCGVNGEKENYFCKNCNEYYADANGEIKLDRNEIITENNHVIIHKPEVVATCTSSGLTAGIYCETCQEEKVKQEIVPAKGHKVVPIGISLNATCSTEGRTAGKKCSVCELVLEEEQTIPKKPHETKVVEGYPATCTEEGLSFGEICIICSFMVKEQEVIPAKGHTDMIVEGKKATCQEDGLTDGLACEVCGLVTKEQEKIAKGAHVPKLIEGKKASCMEDGLTDGSICESCGIILEKQEVIPMNDNHKESVIKGTPSTCTVDGKTDGVECSLCKKILEPQATLPKLPHTEKIVKGVPATCENEGLTDGISCAVCSFEIEKQELIEKLPHTEKIVPGYDATCEKDGKTDGVICGTCEKVLTEQEIIEKLPHTEKILDGVEPTCEKQGVSSGIVCSVCGEVIKAQKILPQKEHTISSSIIRADFDSDGEIAESCAVCKKEISRKKIGRIESVKLSTEKYTYNAKAKKPSLVVKTADGKELKRYTDYNLTYDKGRKAIGTYNVKVEFIGNYSGEKTLTFTVNPSKTDKITVTQTVDSIKLSWSAVEGATGYRVYLYDAKAKKYKALGTTEKLSCSVKKLKAGTEYKFAVKAYTKNGTETLWSKYYTELTTATKPATPAVKGKADTGKASLSWKEISGATGYVVYMSEKKDSGYEKIGSTKKLSCTIKNLKKGKTYYFKVKAYSKVDGKNIYSSATKAIAVKIK